MTLLRITLLLLLVFCGIVAPPSGADEIARIAAAKTAIEIEFKRLDADGDERLKLDEFLLRRGKGAILKRDFRLYDLDADELLSWSEFAAVSGTTRPMFRGTMPDPWDELVADAVAALDESYDNWNERPSEQVNAHIFVANFIGSLSLGGKRYVTGRIVRQADRDADGRLSRTEARGFLQHQLGLRWQFIHPLREPTGRQLRFDRFLAVDENADDALTRAEFAAHWWNRPAAEADFDRNDRNGNGRITLFEYAHYDSDNYFDPIEWFRAADTNLDALLDRGEIIEASGASRRHLAASTVPAFDEDGDQKLSLQEYRLSMHASRNYSWNRRVVDTGGDGRITYDEFVFNDIDLFQLQRRYFFHRLDRDQNQELSSQEFSFLAVGEAPISSGQ